MKNLYVYYLRKRLPVLVAACVTFAILTIIFLSQNDFIRYAIDENQKAIEIPGDNPFLYLSILVSSVATIIPVMEFAFKMKRRSADLFYSMPITRIKLYSVKYLLGLTEVIILCLPQWLISFIWVALKPNMFLMSYYLLYGLCALSFGILIYSFMTFFFTEANSVIDGIIFMGLASCMLPLVIHLIYSFVVKIGGDSTSGLLYMRYYFIYSPFFDVSMKLYYSMCGSYYSDYSYSINGLGLGLNLALSAASILLFFIFSAIRSDAEVISDDSGSYFGYRVMIPAYMVTGFTMAGTFSPLWVIVAMAGYVGYTIYRKNFRIKKRDLFAFAISVIAGLLFASFL